MHYHIPDVFTAWVQFCVVQVHALSCCSCVTAATLSASKLGCRILLLCVLCKNVWQHFEHTGHVMKGDEYSGVKKSAVGVCGV